MSPASVKRDLDYMRNRFNAPIEYDRELNGYRFGRPRSGPRYELPGLWFNAAEIRAPHHPAAPLGSPARAARRAGVAGDRSAARDSRRRGPFLGGDRQAH